MDVWVLTEHQREHGRELLLGVFRTPEMAIRGLRAISKRWPNRPKTIGFYRVHNDLWWLGGYDDAVNYSIARYVLDEPLPITRDGSEDGGAAAAL